MLRLLSAALLAITLAPRADAADPPKTITLHIRITATAEGQLSAVMFEGKPIAAPADKKRTRFDELASILRREMKAAGGDPGRFEVEIDFDDNLKYEYIISTISAVSSYYDENGDPQPLVKNARFRTKDDTPVDDNLKLKLPKPK